jgi:uncharacterized membrane protein
MNPKPSPSKPDLLERLLSAAAPAFVSVVVLAVVAIAAYVFKFHENGWALDPAVWGQFGDYFGGLINPVVGIVTVYLVLLSIAIQRKELQSSLHELKQSNEALATQNAAIALQSFEQTFFAWLANYRDLVSSVTFEGRTGRDAIREMWASLLGTGPVRDRLRIVLPVQEYETAIRSGGVSDANKSRVSEGLLLSWEVIYDRSEHHIDSMFRTLYRLVRWVDEQPMSLLPPEQKWHYISIVRAQLSRVEMIYLFYNGFTDRGRKFAYYINKYAMFDNLDDNEDFGLQFMRQLDESPFDAEAYDSTLAREVLVRPKGAESAKVNPY